MKKKDPDQENSNHKNIFPNSKCTNFFFFFGQLAGMGAREIEELTERVQKLSLGMGLQYSKDQISEAITKTNSNDPQNVINWFVLRRR